MAWFNPVIQKNWSIPGYEISLLSVWALKMKNIFFIITVISLILMICSIFNKLSDKILINTVFALLIIDIVCLMVAVFGYPLPFIVFEPIID